MRLADPGFLLLLLLLPALWYARRGRPTGSIGAARLAGLRQLDSHSARAVWRMRLAGLPLLALGLTILALARPQWGVQATRIDREGISIAMVVDISSSMGARDLRIDERRSNRLEVVKHTFKAFVEGESERSRARVGKADEDAQSDALRQITPAEQASDTTVVLEGRDGDLISLVTFARYSDVRSPLTLDHNALLKLVDDISMVALPEEDGTAIGAGMVAGIENLRRARSASKVLILLTDGSHNAGEMSPMQAAQAASALGIRIYPIGAGTRGVAMMPARKRGGGVEFRPTMVFIDDDGLSAIADLTGGKYFRATDADGLKSIYREINQLETGRNVANSYQQYVEMFTPLAALALALLLLDALLRNTWLRVTP